MHHLVNAKSSCRAATDAIPQTEYGHVSAETGENHMKQSHYERAWLLTLSAASYSLVASANYVAKS